MNKLIIIGYVVVFVNAFLFAQGGKVGINTTTPAAMLHVKDSSVVFTGSDIYPSPTPGNPPVSGTGTRMMWYPGKVAFRAGYVSDTQWNKENIGIGSVALGIHTKASGQSSTAIGVFCQALGNTSVALGNACIASGAVSTALGSNSNAIGTAASAMGESTQAIGYASTALGYYTIASGDISSAMGISTKAIGEGAVSIGIETIAKGDYSISTGYSTLAKSYACFVGGRWNDTTANSTTSWNANDPLFILGNGTSNASRKNALTILKNGRTGINITAPLSLLHVNDGSVVFVNSTTPTLANPPISGAGGRMMWYHNKRSFRAVEIDGNQWDVDSVGYYSMALGKDVVAKGPSSISLGRNTRAYGESSIALGRNTTAYGANSIAIGFNTKAFGDASSAIGGYTEAIADRSLSTGYFSKAKGANSNSFGTQTFSNGYSSTVVGMFNDTIVAAETAGSTTATPLFLVGNGTSHNARSNALTVLKNGNIGIGTSVPGFPLNFSNQLGGKIALWGNSSTHYGIGIQNQLMQFYTDVTGSDIAFGYGSSTSFTENMRIKGNGNVGISTSTPEYKLDVAGRTRIRHSGDGTPGTWYNNSDNSAAVSFIGMFNDSYIGIYSGLGASWNFLMNLNNGNIGIGITPTQKLHVSGNGLFTGTVTASCGVLVCSDVRYKTNIHPLTNSLSNVLALQGIYYDWRKQDFPEKQFDDKKQIGFAAQDLEKIYPEMVHTDEAGFKTVDYSRLTPVLVEAIKEQQEIINALKSSNSHQQNQIDYLMRELLALKEKTNTVVSP